MRHTNKQNVAGITGSTAARYWRATMSRDHRADGTFVLGVRTTHISCPPSCPGRRAMLAVQAGRSGWVDRAGGEGDEAVGVSFGPGCREIWRACEVSRHYDGDASPRLYASDR